MSPYGIATSSTLKTKQVNQTKLWIILVGVNKYTDKLLSPLRYAAIDCQGLANTLVGTGDYFQKLDLQIHHDFVKEVPTLANIHVSLQNMVTGAQAADTILFYFSGHGILGQNNNAYLCLQDTQINDLETTALSVSEVLNLLATCPAKNQLIWLDACHSGGMSLSSKTRNNENGKFDNINNTNPNSIINQNTENFTPQLVNVLQQRAATSQGFYALLSCDNYQQSWEFNELGHGVFTYYLMQGLRGAAANSQGLITADRLYRYVYHQTLHYIDKHNQQLRLINQQNQSRGVAEVFVEYTLQTPKRIVEGVGELIVGEKPSTDLEQIDRRCGIVIDGLFHTQTTLDISKILRDRGDFELEYLQASKSDSQTIKNSLLNCLSKNNSETVLIYLRGRIEETDEWEGFIFGENIRIKRSWLKQQLERCSSKQIIILDCIVPLQSSILLAEWVQELHSDLPQGKCLIAGAGSGSGDIFTQTLFETLNNQALNTSISTKGLSAAGWISQLKIYLAGQNIPLHLWLSGTQGIIEIFPVQNHAQKLKSSQDLGVCPYMGLNAFSEQDSLYFYGREILVQELTHHLSQQSFLAVVGASGSGKSSLVKAGIIPILRQGKQIPDSQSWLIKTMRPGANPLMVLAQVLGDDINHGNGNTNYCGSTNDENILTTQTSYFAKIEGILSQGIESFVYWLRHRREPVLVLVIDQFEEIFTLTDVKEREKFLELIFGLLLYANDRIKIIITLRADFIAPCLEIEQLAIALQKYSTLVPPHLSIDNYRRVIINPAQQVGLQVEPELVEVLLREVNQAVGDLPLLEFVLEQLWQYRVNGQLTLAAYREKLGGIQGALERTSQAVYNSLEPQMQACAKWIFLSLTQLGEGTEDTRRRVFKAELIVAKYPAELVEKTLNALTDAKLVVMGLEDNQENITAIGKGEKSLNSVASFNSHRVTVEVAHEILIRHWSTLRWWLEENRSRLRVQRQIEQATQLWIDSNYCGDFLLQGVRLAEAEDIYMNYTDELSADIQKYIAGCLKERQIQQLQAKRRLRMTQIAVVVMGSLGLIACGLASFAYNKSQQTKLEELKALNSLSENYLLSHKQLDGLVAAVKAAKKLPQSKNWLGLNQSLEMQQIRSTTEENLNQAVVDILESNRLLGHQSFVISAKFSHDGKNIITTTTDKKLKIWRADGKLLTTLSVHQDAVNDADFSPNNQLLLSGGSDGIINIWSRSGQLIRSIKNAHQAEIVVVRFLADSNQFISIGADFQVKFWDMNGNHLKTRKFAIPNINSFAISADFQTIIVATNQAEILFLNQQGEKIKSWFAPAKYQDKISAIALSPNPSQPQQQTITIGSTDGNMTIFSQDGKILQDLGKVHTSKVTRLTYSPDARIIASGSMDNTIKLWSTDGTLIETLAGHLRPINSLAFASNGKTLISASDDKSARLWRLNKIIPNTLRIHTDDVVNIVTSPEGQTFISVSEDGTFGLWNYNGQLLHRFSGHQDAVNNVTFSPDGQIIASASVDKTIKLWHRNGNLIKTIPIQADWFTNLTFSPDGKTLAYTNSDLTIRLLQLEDSRIQTLSGHTYNIRGLAYSPDGKLLVSASSDQTIRLWDNQGSLIKSIPAHDAPIWHVIFAKDGKFFASASQDGTIKIWHPNGDLIRTILAHNHEINKIGISSDGKYIASASDDDTIKIWKTETGKLVKTLTGHNDNVRSIAFSNDGQYIISGGKDSTVRIWEFSSLTASKLDFDSLLARGCNWLGDYLQNNPYLSKEERNLCN